MPSVSCFHQFRVTNILLRLACGAIGAVVLMWQGYAGRIQLPSALLTGAIA
jgi:hypothetical protein